MEKIELQTVQWHQLGHIDAVEPLGDEDYAVLKEVGDVLRKYGKEERFGVCLLHKHFDLSEGEMLVEETDEESRVSTLSVRPASEDIGSSIETAWRFSLSATTVTHCVIRCSYNSGHKRMHVKEGN